MANRLPHLVKNRHGTYYFRLYESGREKRLSLGTKDFQRAKIQVLELNLKLAMSIDPNKLRKLDIVVNPDTGQVTLKDVKEADINTAQTILSHLGVTPAQAMGIDHLLDIPKKNKTSKPVPLESGSGRAGANGDNASQSGTHKNITDVIKLYLTEKKLDNNIFHLHAGSEKCRCGTIIPSPRRWKKRFFQKLLTTLWLVS